jgi:DNA-binding NarL/FixJ family response regulator
LLKSDAGKDIVDAVVALSQGKPYFNSRVGDIVLNGYLEGKEIAPPFAAPGKLTPREREVIQLIVEGQSTKEIANILGVSVKTAETHRSNVMRKLQVHSVSELVLLAVRNNIVQLGQTTEPVNASGLAA